MGALLAGLLVAGVYGAEALSGGSWHEWSARIGPGEAVRQTFVLPSGWSPPAGAGRRCACRPGDPRPVYEPVVRVQGQEVARLGRAFTDAGPLRFDRVVMDSASRQGKVRADVPQWYAVPVALSLLREGRVTVEVAPRRPGGPAGEAWLRVWGDYPLRERVYRGRRCSRTSWGRITRSVGCVATGTHALAPGPALGGASRSGARWGQGRRRRLERGRPERRPGTAERGVPHPAAGAGPERRPAGPLLMQATAAHVPAQAWPRVVLAWLSLLLLAALPAALWTVALLGRSSVAGLSGRWVATWLLGTLGIVLWVRWAGHGRSLPALAAGLAPAGALAGAALLALYASDGAYHRFVFEPLGKGLLLPATAVLALGAPAFAAGREMGAVLAGGRGLLVTVTLGGVGVLQALHLLNVATDDLIRYWAIADAMLQGMGYPVTEGTPGGGGFYLIDQPLYPLLILPAFQALGHRYLALHVPLMVANAVLPFVLFALARASRGARGTSRLGALGLSLAVLCFPYYQVYALGAADPEPLWAVLAGLLLWLAMRVSDAGGTSRCGSGAPWAWRPRRRPSPAPRGRSTPAWPCWGWDGTPACAGRGGGWRRTLCAVPVALFSLFLWREFGVLSPSGWLRIASRSHLGPNLEHGAAPGPPPLRRGGRAAVAHGERGAARGGAAGAGAVGAGAPVAGLPGPALRPLRPRPQPGGDPAHPAGLRRGRDVPADVPAPPLGALPLARPRPGPAPARAARARRRSWQRGSGRWWWRSCCCWGA